MATSESTLSKCMVHCLHHARVNNPRTLFGQNNGPFTLHRDGVVVGKAPDYEGARYEQKNYPGSQVVDASGTAWGRF